MFWVRLYAAYARIEKVYRRTLNKVRSTSKKDTHLCVWAAGCESSYGGILKARSYGSKELLLIGRCPKYNKTAISLSFFEVGERSEVGVLEKLPPRCVLRVNHELITHHSAPYVYFRIYPVILTAHPTWNSLSIDLPAQRFNFYQRSGLK